MNYTLIKENRIGDHIWYISDVHKFRRHYPEWEYRYTLNYIIQQIHDSYAERL